MLQTRVTCQNSVHDWLKTAFNFNAVARYPAAGNDTQNARYPEAGNETQNARYPAAGNETQNASKTLDTRQPGTILKMLRKC